MNDTDSRLQESLLPISHNSAAFNAQRAQRAAQLAQTTSASSRFAPIETATYVTTTQPATDESWGRAKKSCWWIAVVLTVVLVFLIVALKLFLFKPISHGPPKLDNSTATEPNTKTKFNLLLQGPRNRVMSLTGAAPWEYTIPIPTHPKIVIAAVGYYVERAEGKRRLRKYEGEEITDELFEDIKSSLLQQPGMTETMRVVLATTPPSGRMLEMWQDNTEPILQRDCPKLEEQEWNAFSSFFPDPFNKGDDFTFEWREGQDLYAFRKGEDRTRAKRIGGPCMARALFESQLDEQKQTLLNLLEDFFTR